MQRQNQRAIIIIVIICAVIIPLALLSMNPNINLRGSAVMDTPQEETVEQPSPADSADAADSQAPAEAAVAATAIPPTPFPPTAIPPTDVPPTATSVPEIGGTGMPTDTTSELVVEATETLTAPPETEATEEATAEFETTPEAELTAEATPEAELTPEITPEATDEPIVFDIVITCTGSGTTFTVTNVGADMAETAAYSIDDVEAGQAMLLSGESLTIDAGFGTPRLMFADAEAQPEMPCLPPPDLAVTLECALESGVTFTIANISGAMQAEQAYTIEQAGNETVSGSFQLDEGESIAISAGYGDPTFVSGDLNAHLETPCNAPAPVDGRIWLDSDGDGAIGVNEPGISGVVVALVNADGYAFETVTSDDGHYDFFPVGEGNYIIQVRADSLSAEVQISADPDGELDSSAALDAAPSENYTLNFGYHPLGTAILSGMVWLETGNFGTRDSGESGLSGVAVQLLDANGEVIATVEVTADGAYHFDELSAGSYTLRLAAETLPQPFGVTFNPDSLYDLETPVTVTAGEIIDGIDFGIVGTF